MRMGRLIAIGLGLAAIFLAALGCNGERVSGGTVETENVYAISVDSLLPPWNHPSTYATVGTIRLDTSNFPFARSTADARDIALETPAGARLAYEKVFWDSAAEKGRLRVRLDTASLRRGARVLLRWGLASGAKPDPTATWKGISASQKLAITSVPLDDFEHGTLQSLLPGGGPWYKGRSSDSVTVNEPVLAAAGGRRTGTALHLSYDASLKTYEFALAGVVVGPTFRSFRALDSVVLWVRGSGKLSIAFDRLITGRPGKAWTSRTLDTAWTRLCIRPQDFDAPSSVGNNLGWTVVRDSITNFTLLVAGGKDLWVDDIRFHGMEWDDFR